MTRDRETTQLVLLRILGVLLILVGFTMIAQQVRSDHMRPVEFAESVFSVDKAKWPSCDRKTSVHVRTIRLPDIPAPPAPPAPPPPPAPPAPPVWSF